MIGPFLGAGETVPPGGVPRMVLFKPISQPT